MKAYLTIDMFMLMLYSRLLIVKERCLMEHTENYMLVHPMEMNQAANLKQEESKLLEEQSLINESLRHSRLVNSVGTVASIGLLGAGAYEIGLNINDGRSLVALSAASSIATGVGMLRRNLLEHRKSLVDTRLNRTQEYIAKR